ncbi:MAG: hypothetical protein MHM6MM_004226 [Cercozoa sp. M6MM]
MERLRVSEGISLPLKSFVGSDPTRKHVFSREAIRCDLPVAAIREIERDFVSEECNGVPSNRMYPLAPYEGQSDQLHVVTLGATCFVFCVSGTLMNDVCVHEVVEGSGDPKHTVRRVLSVPLSQRIRKLCLRVEGHSVLVLAVSDTSASLLRLRLRQNSCPDHDAQVAHLWIRKFADFCIDGDLTDRGCCFVFPRGSGYEEKGGIVLRCFDLRGRPTLSMRSSCGGTATRVIATRRCLRRGVLALFADGSLRWMQGDGSVRVVARDVVSVTTCLNDRHAHADLSLTQVEHDPGFCGNCGAHVFVSTKHDTMQCVDMRSMESEEWQLPADSAARSLRFCGTGLVACRGVPSESAQAYFVPLRYEQQRYRSAGAVTRWMPPLPLPARAAGVCIVSAVALRRSESAQTNEDTDWLGDFEAEPADSTGCTLDPAVTVALFLTNLGDLFVCCYGNEQSQSLDSAREVRLCSPCERAIHDASNRPVRFFSSARMLQRLRLRHRDPATLVLQRFPAPAPVVDASVSFESFRQLQSSQRLIEQQRQMDDVASLLSSQALSIGDMDALVAKHGKVVSSDIVARRFIRRCGLQWHKWQDSMPDAHGVLHPGEQQQEQQQQQTQDKTQDKIQGKTQAEERERKRRRLRPPVPKFNKGEQTEEKQAPILRSITDFGPDESQRNDSNPSLPDLPDFVADLFK